LLKKKRTLADGVYRVPCHWGFTYKGYAIKATLGLKRLGIYIQSGLRSFIAKFKWGFTNKSGLNLKGIRHIMAKTI